MAAPIVYPQQVKDTDRHLTLDAGTTFHVWSYSPLTSLAVSTRHDGQCKLSAIIACYRDAPAVPVMYKRLVAVFDNLGADFEIIFVNDGSPDDARVVLAELAARDSRVIVINHSRNFGSQSAFTSGMA